MTRLVLLDIDSDLPVFLWLLVLGMACLESQMGGISRILRAINESQWSGIECLLCMCKIASQAYLIRMAFDHKSDNFTELHHHIAV